FHLFNIFLKFIQDHYQLMKYYPQITFIIELFAKFIEVKPAFFSQKNLSLNSHFQSKISELEEVSLQYCQKLFLNNGSVEIFLKIVCEGNHAFNQIIYPTILKFFNNVLENGNNEAQEKFYEMFYFFNNS